MDPIWVLVNTCVLPECCIKLYNLFAVNEEAKSRKLLNWQINNGHQRPDQMHEFSVHDRYFS